MHGWFMRGHILGVFLISSGVAGDFKMNLRVIGVEQRPAHVRNRIDSGWLSELCS